MRATSVRVALIATVALALPQPASADLRQSLAKCAATVGDLDRLECFDRITERERLDRPQVLPTETKGTGAWRVYRDRNPIDDTERVILQLTAKSGVGTWGKPVTAVARCKSNKTEFYIDWNDYVGDDSNDVYRDWKYVTIRIGNRKAQRQQWSISTDKKATFAPNWAGNLLKEMARSNRFIAQLTPYNSNPITAVFNTTGLANALKPLAETCNWSLE